MSILWSPFFDCSLFMCFLSGFKFLTEEEDEELFSCG